MGFDPNTETSPGMILQVQVSHEKGKYNLLHPWNLTDGYPKTAIFERFPPEWVDGPGIKSQTP